MDSFIAALKGALELCKTCKEFLQTAKEITDSMRETQLKLAKEAADVARQEASDFREALRSAEASGGALMTRYENLRKELIDFANFTSKFTSNRSRTVSKGDIADGNRKLRSVLLHAKTCFDNYPTFKDKLWKAIDNGTRLMEKCKVGSQDASARAADTRVLGYGGSGLLGVGATASVVAVAAGFLTIATGGIGAAVLGIVAAGAGAHTRNRAQQLDSLASDFRALQGKLETDVANLNRVADKIEGNQEMTRVMVEELEIRLRLAMQDTVTMSATN